MTWRIPNPQSLFQEIRIAFGDLSKYLDRLEAENNPAWTAVTFTNGWVDYGLGWQSAAYRKRRDGNVEMRGLVKNGTMGAAMFTLPVGYRPPLPLLFPVIATNAIGRLDVNANGVVLADAAIGANGFIDLNVTFSTRT